MMHLKKLARSTLLTLFLILFINLGYVPILGTPKVHAGLFPTKLVSITPLTQSNATHNVGDTFILEAYVTANIYDSGALSLILTDGGSTELSRSCINVVPSLFSTDVAFLTDDALSVVQGSSGSTTYVLSAQFHKGISCNKVTTPSSNKISMNYVVNWQPLPLPTCYPVAGNVSNDRAAILLRGMTTYATSLEDNMSYWTQMSSVLANDYENLIYFSYNRNDPFAYTVYDTYTSVTTEHAPLLKDLLQSCKLTLGAETQIDVVGHSQGGLVAFEYMRNYATLAQYSDLVDHVFIMDSPVNGAAFTQMSDFIATLIEVLQIPDPDDYVAALRGDGVKRMEYMSRNYANVYQDNVQLLEDLVADGASIHMISNKKDSFVNLKDALVAGYDAKFDVGTNDLIAQYTTNHRILKDRFAEYTELVGYYNAIINDEPNPEQYIYLCGASASSPVTFYKDYGCRASEGSIDYSTPGWYLFDLAYTYEVSSVKIAPGYSLQLLNIDGGTQCLTGYVSDLSTITYNVFGTQVDNNSTSFTLFANSTCSIF